MNADTDHRIYFFANGLGEAIGPDDAELHAQYEALIWEDYERCHPNDSFDALRHRARFSKEDRGLLRDWMNVAARRARQTQPVRQAGRNGVYPS